MGAQPMARILVAGVTVAAASCATDASEGAIPTSGPAPVSTVAPVDQVPPADQVEPAESAPPPTSAPPPASTSEPPGATASSTVRSTTTATSAASTTTTTAPPAPPPPNEQFAGLRFGLEPVVDIDHPTAVTWRDRDDAMYVATQDGLVVRVLGESTDVVLDLTEETTPFAPGSERGLLGLAFDPRDGRMFVDYTDRDNDTHVVSYVLDGGIAVPSSRREYLFIEQPGLGHNGGRLIFDDAGNLYIGSGDGGGSNGRDAQDTTKLFGAILRITPDLDGPGYSIPPDNPFADGAADRPEVLARGLRNPWGFSLDRATGDLWIGDVGNDTREEIDVMRAGELGLNFGWYWFEGNHQRRSDPPPGLTPPVFDYDRSVGVAVMGGYVYRGEAIPELVGAYLFADLGGPIWAIGAGGVTRLDAERVSTVVGWAEDPAGELYVLALDDGVFRLVRR